MHAPTQDSLGRGPAGLEEPRGPQPPVDPHLDPRRNHERIRGSGRPSTTVRRVVPGRSVDRIRCRQKRGEPIAPHVAADAPRRPRRASAAFAKASFPEEIALPNGWQPEGIAIGNGTTFYVGSIPTGAVYRGDLRTGRDAARPERTRTRRDRDRVRPRRLFVAGGATGKGFVYDARTGAQSASCSSRPARGDVRQRRRGHEARGVLHRLQARRALSARCCPGTGRPASRPTVARWRATSSWCRAAST